MPGRGDEFLSKAGTAVTLGRMSAVGEAGCTLVEGRRGGCGLEGTRDSASADDPAVLTGLDGDVELR